MDGTEAEKSLKVRFSAFESPALYLKQKHKHTGDFCSGQERDSVFKIRHQLQQRARDVQEGQCCFPRREPLPCPNRYVQETEQGGQYELVEPGTHNATAEADNLAEPVQQSKTQAENDKKRRAKARIVVEHLDIIKDDFWDRRPWLLSNKPGKVPKEP